MKRFWWVNHKQTVRQEIGGGYLWSPKKESNGARSQFYDNMREASLGDIVISFAHGKVGNIGILTDFAFSSPKPAEFGNIGKNWSREGWLLPVAWQPVPKKVRPKELLPLIREFLPKRYSPLNSETGDGNQKAYFSEISSNIFDVIASECHFDISNFNSITSSSKPELIEIIDGLAEEEVKKDDSLNQTEKQQIIKARVGQGIFRKNLFDIERGCRLSGITTPGLLVASHIKPWRSCLSATERLDGFNGLLLAPHIDHLFDEGFISFTGDGNVIVSPRVDLIDLQMLGLENVLTKSAGQFKEKHLPYLEYHRTVIFLK